MENNELKYLNKSNKSQKTNKKSFGFLWWILKSEIIIVVLLMIVKLIIHFFPNELKYVISNKDIRYNNLGIDYIDIEKSIDNNINITELEKEFIKSKVEKEINENKKYINLNVNINRLSDVKIIYNNMNLSNRKIGKYDILDERAYKNGISGSYNEFLNKIDLYDVNNKDFSYENCDKEVLFHEINHLISNNNKYNSISNNKNILSETINELFTREYYNEDRDYYSYEEYMYMAYILAEILPDSIIREYKFSDNENVLIKGLLEIDNNIDSAYEFIDSIKSKNYVNIQKGVKHYYEKKKNEKIENNLSILFYMYNTPIETVKCKNIVEKFLNGKKIKGNITITPRGYFSNDYIEYHKNIIVKYFNGSILNYKEIIE